jgi:hypothetical protein
MVEPPLTVGTPGGLAKPGPNQGPTHPDLARPSQTSPDTKPALKCGNRTQRDVIRRNHAAWHAEDQGSESLAARRTWNSPAHFTDSREDLGRGARDPPFGASKESSTIISRGVQIRSLRTLTLPGSSSRIECVRHAQSPTFIEQQFDRTRRHSDSSRAAPNAAERLGRLTGQAFFRYYATRYGHHS